MGDHSIMISDDLWEAYDRSPRKMRDTLYQALVQSDKPEHEDRCPTSRDHTLRLPPLR